MNISKISLIFLAIILSKPITAAEPFMDNDDISLDGSYASPESIDTGQRVAVDTHPEPALINKDQIKFPQDIEPLIALLATSITLRTDIPRTAGHYRDTVLRRTNVLANLIVIKLNRDIDTLKNNPNRCNDCLLLCQKYIRSSRFIENELDSPRRSYTSKYSQFQKGVISRHLALIATAIARYQSSAT